VGRVTRSVWDEEFKSFKELARKLLGVTKKELDRQKSAHQKQGKKNTKSAG
jgi:hypothetical protein